MIDETKIYEVRGVHGDGNWVHAYEMTDHVAVELRSFSVKLTPDQAIRFASQITNAARRIQKRKNPK